MNKCFSNYCIIQFVSSVGFAILAVAIIMTVGIYFPFQSYVGDILHHGIFLFFICINTLQFQDGMLIAYGAAVLGQFQLAMYCVQGTIIENAVSEREDYSILWFHLNSCMFGGFVPRTERRDLRRP